MILFVKWKLLLDFYDVRIKTEHNTPCFPHSLKQCFFKQNIAFFFFLFFYFNIWIAATIWAKDNGAIFRIVLLFDWLAPITAREPSQPCNLLV